MRKASLLAVGAMFIAAAAFAGGQNDAGCGVGSLIFKQNDMGAQVLADTTNQFLGQSFSITTGTVGCTASGNLSQSTKSAAVQRAQKNFVAANYRDLSREMATGQGEYLSSLADLLGCRPALVPALGKLTQSKYGKIFPSKNAAPSQVLGALKVQIKGNAKLANSCSLI